VARTPCASPQARHRVRSHRVFVFVWNRAALEEADQQERYREARDREAAEDKPDRKVVGHDKDGSQKLLKHDSAYRKIRRRRAAQLQTRLPLFPA